MARQLAVTWSWTYFGLDDHFDEHGRRLGSSAPTYAKVAALGDEERLAQPIATQVSDVCALAEEQLAPVLDDLGRIPGPVLVEGAALLPRLLVDCGVEVSDAIWLVPTEAFQRQHYARRDWARALVDGLDDPAYAFEQWMRRDATYARLIGVEAQRLGYRVLTIDGQRSLDDVTALIADHLLGP